MFSLIFNQILYRPLLNAVVFIYSILPGHDFGWAIIMLTLIIRFIFMPLSMKALKSQKALNEIAPKMQEIKEKHKNNQAAQSAAMMQLYKEHKVNPFAGCLPLLIQLPVIFTLYQVFRAGVNAKLPDLLYSFVPHPAMINNHFLGIIDITQRNIALILIAGITQYIQSRQQAKNSQTQKTNKEIAAFNNQMLNFMPIMIIIIGWSLPAGLMLYIIATTVFSIFEQIVIQHKNQGHAS